MRRPFIINPLFFAFFVLYSTFSHAQVLKAEADTAFYEVRQLTDKWYKAIRERDSVTLEQILADNYTVDGTWPRSKWMDNIMHHFKMDSFEVVKEPTMDYFGDAVVSKGILFWKGTRDGKPFMNAEFAVTDIWVKKTDKWQVYLRLLKFLKPRN